MSGEAPDGGRCLLLALLVRVGHGQELFLQRLHTCGQTKAFTTHTIVLTTRVSWRTRCWNAFMLSPSFLPSTLCSVALPCAAVSRRNLFASFCNSISRSSSLSQSKAAFRFLLLDSKYYIKINLIGCCKEMALPLGVISGGRSYLESSRTDFLLEKGSIALIFLYLRTRPIFCRDSK